MVTDNKGKVGAIKEIPIDTNPKDIMKIMVNLGVIETKEETRTAEENITTSEDNISEDGEGKMDNLDNIGGDEGEVREEITRDHPKLNTGNSNLPETKEELIREFSRADSSILNKYKRGDLDRIYLGLDVKVDKLPPNKSTLVNEIRKILSIA